MRTNNRQRTARWLASSLALTLSVAICAGSAQAQSFQNDPQNQKKGRAGKQQQQQPPPGKTAKPIHRGGGQQGPGGNAGRPANNTAKPIHRRGPQGPQGVPRGNAAPAGNARPVQPAPPRGQNVFRPQQPGKFVPNPQGNVRPAQGPQGHNVKPIERHQQRDLRQEFRIDRRQDHREFKQEKGNNQRLQVEQHRERQFERRRDANEQKFHNIDALRQGRREQQLGKGRVVLQEPDNRRIYRGAHGAAFIRHDDNARLRRFGNDITTKQGRNGRNITTMRRRDGVVIVSETGPDGRLIRRYRRGPNGHTVTLIDNRRTWRRWGAIGAAAAIGGLIVAIEAPRYYGPRERYIVEYDDASYDDIYDALDAPPVAHLDRGYSLDEVLATRNLREYMRRIDLDSINFEFGSWQVDPSQYRSLERMARAIHRLIDKIVLIEGHTDAVGDETDNLTLSDRRAEEVANILTEEFDIPPENLVTQGYGEQFLKVDTDGPERANRRVTIRRITPLLERRTSKYEDD